MYELKNKLNVHPTDKEWRKLKRLVNKHVRYLTKVSPGLSYSEFRHLSELVRKFNCLTNDELKEIRDVCWPGGYKRYLANVLDRNGVKEIVGEVCENLKPIKDQFDAIAFTGASGSLVAPIVCYRLKKNPLYLRYEDSRSKYIPLESYPCDTCIIIDDFISSGSTMRRMLSTLEPYCKCVGIYLYNQLWSFLKYADGYNTKKHRFENTPVIEPLKE